MAKHGFKAIEALDITYVLPTYARARVAFVKGKGARLQDTQGRDYIDFGSGIGVASLGHSHKALQKALKKSAKTLIHTSNLYYIEPQAKLAARLVEYYKRGDEGKPNTQKSDKSKWRVFFGNSGAEANECAIKIARKYGQKDGRYKIITLDSSFHGRTIATLKATGQDKFHKHFAPFPDGFVRAKDLSDIPNKLDSETAAVFIELVQGEGGINALDKKQVQHLAKILKKQNILLMVDEVQSGIYRSGEIFASKVYGIEPDVITMAKGLAGGVPIGACMTRLIDVFESGDHGSTFGGNFLSTNAGLCVLKTLEKMRKDRTLESTTKYFHTKLDSVLERYPAVFSKRVGLGLMCGLQVRSEEIFSQILSACLRHRVLVLRSGGNVLRFLPPLTITKSEIDEGFTRLLCALKELKISQTQKTAQKSKNPK